MDTRKDLGVGSARLPDRVAALSRVLHCQTSVERHGGEAPSDGAEQSRRSSGGVTAEPGRCGSLDGVDAGHESVADTARTAAVASFLLVVFIVGVIQQFADYQQAWTALSNMSVGWWLAILIAAVANQISYVWPYQALLPSLRFRDGFTEIQTTSAI